MGEHISKEDARKFLIRYHYLDGSQGLVGAAGVLDYVKRVGSIQYDPLNVVGRNADLVLQSRVKGYTPDLLEKLLYEDRLLIDGWDKMMSIYQQADWPFFRRVRDAKKAELKRILGRRSSLEALELVDEIRGLIKESGPMQPNEISMGSNKSGRWGHRKLSSAALDYMFNVGELGVSHKRNTQKVYDLVENLLAPAVLKQGDPFAGDDDFYRWYIKRRVASVGLLWGKNGGAWLGHYVSDAELRQAVLSSLVDNGELIELQIDGIKEAFYLPTEYAHLLGKRDNDNGARFLAPLDNLLWDRGMTERLFDFSYSWEVYIPVEKRKYGYYVLPVLYNDQFVARFEPEMHRGNGPLVIKNWWWEDGVEVTNEIKQAIDKAIEEFCMFLGADGIDKSFTL